MSDLERAAFEKWASAHFGEGAMLWDGDPVFVPRDPGAASIDAGPEWDAWLARSALSAPVSAGAEAGSTGGNESGPRRRKTLDPSEDATGHASAQEPDVGRTPPSVPSVPALSAPAPARESGAEEWRVEVLTNSGWERDSAHSTYDGACERMRELDKTWAPSEKRIVPLRALPVPPAPEEKPVAHGEKESAYAKTFGEILARDICESEPCGAVIEAQDRLKGTDAETFLVIEPKVLAEFAARNVDNAFYDGEIRLLATPPAPDEVERADRVVALEDSIRRWHHEKYGRAALLAPTVRKLGEEFGEFCEAAVKGDVPAMTEEAADVALILTNLVRAVGGGSLFDAMETKHEVCKQRLAAERAKGGDRG